MTSTILLVDDEIDISELVKIQFRRQIRKKEVEFIFAINGVEALDELANNSQIDMVMTDINMPEMDGLTLIGEMRELYPRVKTVVISAYNDMSNIRAAMNHGAFDFLNKPLQKEDLSITINKTLAAINKERQILEHLEKVQRTNVQIEVELQTAAAVQQALFPKSIPPIENLALATHYESASQTGGDWYGFMTQIENFLYVMIGDVTGHGTPAALITAIASGACMLTENIHSDKNSRSFDRRFINPKLLLKNLNFNIHKAGAPNFLMTFFVGCLDLNSGELLFSNAAHVFPIVLQANGEIKSLLNTNLRLGEQENSEYEEKSIQLKGGDLIFFYTDGVTELQNSENEMWGDSRLKRFLKKHHGKSAETLKTLLLDELKAFQGGQPLADDLTFVICQVLKDWEPQAAS